MSMRRDFHTQIRERFARRLAATIKRLRLEREWTQEQAARACGMSVRLFQRCESGTCNTTLATLARLGAGFDVEACDLFQEGPQ